MAVTRSRHTDAKKRKAVAFAVKMGSATAAAEKFEVWESMIRTWSRDPRYGGKASNFVRAKSTKPNGRTNSAGLPVNVAPSMRAKVIREAEPVVFKCPHCGERFRIRGDDS